MGTLKTFAADLRLATADIEPVAVGAALARFAREQLAEAIASGAASPSYDRYVNGRLGVSEFAVEPPGPILYLFAGWEEVIPWTLDRLVKRSPELRGRYKAGHTAFVDWQPVVDPAAVPRDATVIFTSPVDYVRKIEVGGQRMRVRPHIYEDVYAAVRRRFGGPSGFIDASFTYQTIPNGYVLRGRFRRGPGAFARKGLRRGTRAGDPLTYPCIVMRMRGYAEGGR